jgi:hypothetical protein
MSQSQRETIANAAAMLDGMALEIRRNHALPPSYTIIPEPEVAQDVKRIKRVVAELYDIARDEA